MARSIKKGPYVASHLEKKVTEFMVGHKLGEFAPTRQFKGHSSKKVD